MNNLQDRLALREANITELERELEKSRQRALSSEKTLERFQRKINRLRVALTREIERVSYSNSQNFAYIVAWNVYVFAKIYALQ